MLCVALSIATSLSWQLAEAAEWRVDPERSSIGFEYLRAGLPAKGIFHRFRGKGVFDRADPSSARLTLIIDSSSIDLFDALASAFATSAEWFDSKNHREMTYHLTRLMPLDDDHYDALGDLTIRGKTRPIRTEITLSIHDSQAEATGGLNVVRDDYLLGYGPSAAFVEIGQEVTVRFNLVAAAEGSP